MENRLCTKCNLEKPICDFVKNSSKKSGYASSCKECHRKECLKYYYNNKLVIRKNSNKYRNKILEYVNKVKEQGCTNCGELDKACLDFHHLRDKTENISRLVNNDSLDKIIKEISKCIVLCSNCHRKLHYYNNH